MLSKIILEPKAFIYMFETNHVSLTAAEAVEEYLSYHEGQRQCSYGDELRNQLVAELLPLAEKAKDNRESEEAS
jgi:hypothetical protein